jgi:hypothetical protein
MTKERMQKTTQQQEFCTPEVGGPQKSYPTPAKQTHEHHGFDRNASHSADVTCVCECEGWEPVDNAYTKNDIFDRVLHKENT